MSEEEVKKELADKLRELKKRLDKMFAFKCEQCSKPLPQGFGEVHGYVTKEREVILCYDCLCKHERGEEG